MFLHLLFRMTPWTVTEILPLRRRIHPLNFVLGMYVLNYSGTWYPSPVEIMMITCVYGPSLLYICGFALLPSSDRTSSAGIYIHK